MKFSISNFCSKCDQIRKKLRIWSHLLKKSLMENFTFCVVLSTHLVEFYRVASTAKLCREAIPKRKKLFKKILNNLQLKPTTNHCVTPDKKF